MIIKRFSGKLQTLWLSAQPEIGNREWGIGNRLFAIPYWLFPILSLLAFIGCTSKLEKQPDHYNLGIEYYKKEMFDEAIKELEMAVKVVRTDALNVPNLGDAYHMLGLAYIKKGSPDEAIASYKKAVEINPNSAELHGDLALTYNHKGMINESILEYREAIEI